MYCSCDMNEYEKLINEIENFRVERDWKQFHTPKNLAISLALEAAEVLEHFQWKNDQQIEEYVVKSKEELGDEVADVFIYLMLLSNDLEIDLFEAAFKKLKKNAEKYPVEKAKGVATKYNKL